MSSDEIDIKIQQGKDFIKNRITELRLKTEIMIVIGLSI